jgi:hypothetical protein
MTPVRYAIPLSLVSVTITKYNHKLQQAIVTDKACFFGLINTGKACLAGVVITSEAPLETSRTFRLLTRKNLSKLNRVSTSVATDISLLSDKLL